MLRRTILEDYEVPTAPMATDQPQERLVRISRPILGDQQRQIAAPNIDRPMEHPLGVRPTDRHPHLLTDGSIAVIQRRCLGDDRLVQPRDHVARAARQAAFKPPYAWRQASGGAANSGRGRFQRTSRRAIATLILLREALIPWDCSKSCRSNSAVQT